MSRNKPKYDLEEDNRVLKRNNKKKLKKNFQEDYDDLEVTSEYYSKAIKHFKNFK